MDRNHGTPERLILVGSRILASTFKMVPNKVRRDNNGESQVIAMQSRYVYLATGCELNFG